MRTVRDRIRQAIAFEVIGLALVMTFGARLFGLHAADLGLVALAISLIATGWNYAFNLGYDHLLARIGVRKTVSVRVAHAVLFETGLLVASLPLIAWWLDMGLWAAFVMDVALAAFYVVYAFVFTWVYDLVFPAGQGRAEATGSCGCP